MCYFLVKLASQALYIDRKPSWALTVEVRVNENIDAFG